MWPRKEKKETDSVRALEDAAQQLKRIQERGPAVAQESRGLRRIRERNHFVEELQIIMRGS